MKLQWARQEFFCLLSLSTVI